MAAASWYGKITPFPFASSNFISGSSVPSMCTCSSHFGMPAMKSRRSLMTISCPRPGLTINKAFVELLCYRHHAYRQTAVQATAQAHRSVTNAVERWEVYREFERTLQIDHPQMTERGLVATGQDDADRILFRSRCSGPGMVMLKK